MNGYWIARWFLSFMAGAATANGVIGWLTGHEDYVGWFLFSIVCFEWRSLIAANTPEPAKAPNAT